MMKVSASILSADFANLSKEIEKSSDADMLHIDVMDGMFVPNITVGSCVISAIKNITDKILDVHLMINNPSRYINEFITAGADIVTIHLESEVHLCRTLQMIRDKGKKSGLAIVPSTNPINIKYLLPYVDLIIVMTVNPGFGGQKFMPCQVEKIKKIKDMIREKDLNIQISVDGGINNDTAKIVKKAGADILVAGSYIYSNNEYNKRINILQNI